MKPIFEVAKHLRSGALVPVARKNPPVPVNLACLSPHRRLKDPKVQLFADFMIAHIKAQLAEATRGLVSSPGRTNIRMAK